MKTEPTAQVGGRIRAARQAHGWTQRDLAQRLNRRQATISRWESGDRALTVGDLMAVAEVLGVEPGELLQDSNENRENGHG